MDCTFKDTPQKAGVVNQTSLPFELPEQGYAVVASDFSYQQGRVNFSLRDASGKAFFIGQLAPEPFFARRGVPSLKTHTLLSPGKHRMTILLNMDENNFDFFLDEEAVFKGVPFFDGGKLKGKATFFFTPGSRDPAQFNAENLRIIHRNQLTEKEKTSLKNIRFSRIIDPRYRQNFSPDALTCDPFAGIDLDKPPTPVSPVKKSVVDNVNVTEMFLPAGPNKEPFYVIAAVPELKKAEKLPGMLIIHGGAGSAEKDKCISWAQRGYTAVAMDLPGIVNPAARTTVDGRKDERSYALASSERFYAWPDAKASVLYDAVSSALKALAVLRSLPETDPQRIGVVGISWGGYTSIMVGGIAGDKVKAVMSVFGSGFYDLIPGQSVNSMPEKEREIFLKYLDAGRRAGNIRGSFFIAAATNDFFFAPDAVVETLRQVKNSNFVFSPNSNHKIIFPGGSTVNEAPPEDFVPTPEQLYPTPRGSKANWLYMEVPFFEKALKDKGEVFPEIFNVKIDGRKLTFQVRHAGKIKSSPVWYTPVIPGQRWTRAKWQNVPAQEVSPGNFAAELPDNGQILRAYPSISDDRDISVSGQFVETGKNR